jgi:hypothetical protein
VQVNITTATDSCSGCHVDASTKCARTSTQLYCATNVLAMRSRNANDATNAATRATADAHSPTKIITSASLHMHTASSRASCASTDYR